MSRSIGFACGESLEFSSAGEVQYTYAVVDGKQDKGVFRVESFDDWISVIPIGNKLRITVKPFVGTNARNVSPDLEIPTEYDPELDPAHIQPVDLKEREGTIVLTHVADASVTAELTVKQKAEEYGLQLSKDEVSLSDLMPTTPNDTPIDIMVKGGSKSFCVKSIKKKRLSADDKPITMTFDDAVFTSQERIIEGTDTDVWRLHVKSYGRIDMRNELNDDTTVYYEITVCHVDRPRELVVIKANINSSKEELPPNPVIYAASVEEAHAAPEETPKKSLRTKKKTEEVVLAGQEEDTPSIDVLGAKNGVLDFGCEAGSKILLVNTVPNDVMITTRAISDYVFCDVDKHKVTVRIEPNYATTERRCIVVIGHGEKYNVKQSIIVRQEGKRPNEE